MNQDQLSLIHAQLNEMKKQLLVKNAELVKQEHASDPLDQAQQEMQSMVQLRQKSLDTDLLSEVEMALYKIQCGEYGYCEISGEPISIQRLQANPTSRTSIEEQERLEHTRMVHRRTAIS